MGRLFDFSDNTQKSLRFFQEHAGEFDEFVEVLAFFEERDAILYGFVDAWPANPGSDPRFRYPAAARLILRDRQGHELWLGGCNCGYPPGEGPDGSQEVLRWAKFPEHLVELIPHYRVLHLDKHRGVVEARKPSAEEVRRTTGLSRRRTPWHSTVYIVDGTPMLLLGHTLTGEFLRRWQAEGMEWVPAPKAAALYLDDAAAAADLRYPGARTRDYPPVYNLVIRDASDRELWLYVPVVVKQRLDRHGLEAAAALLTICGFDLKDGDAGSFLGRIRAVWRARQDPVLRFQRDPAARLST